MPQDDLYGLKKATSIGPSREFDASKWSMGMLPPPFAAGEGSFLPEVGRNILGIGTSYGLGRVREKGLKYVDENVEGSNSRALLKAALNIPLLLKGQNPISSVIKKKKPTEFQRSEKNVTEWMNEMANTKRVKEFHSKFIQQLKSVLNKQGGNKSGIVSENKKPYWQEYLESLSVPDLWHERAELESLPEIRQNAYKGRVGERIREKRLTYVTDLLKRKAIIK